MLRLRSRRGAIIVMVGVMFMAIVAISAIAIDFSRLWSVKNELETSADAAALAGAIQLFPPHQKDSADYFARRYAAQNIVMGGTDSVEQVIIGKWDDNTATFTAGAVDSTAIRVIVSRQSSGLIMNAFGIPSPRMRAEATAWAEAPVATTACIKPWAVPYIELMKRINAFRGIDTTVASNNNRNFDQVNDIAALNSMSVSERSFVLKEGGGSNDPTTAGFYQKVQLPQIWTPNPLPSGTKYPNGPLPSTNPNFYYEQAVMGNGCFGLGVGDSLDVLTGNDPNGTINALDKTVAPDPYGVCESISANGDCMNASGTPGVDIKAAFYRNPQKCTGTTCHVEVTLLGSFTLLKAYPNNRTPGFKTSDIVGVFTPVQDSGPIGGGSTTLQRPILVR